MRVFGSRLPALTSAAFVAMHVASMAMPTVAFAQSSDASGARGGSVDNKAASGAGASGEAKATEYKIKGDEALDRKRFEEAVAAYDASYALRPNAALLYNRGRALEFLARYPEALASIERFSTEAPADLRARVPGLEKLLGDLRARVGSITIACHSRGARVLLDRRQIGVCPVPSALRVNAGKQVLEVFAEGFFPYRREVELRGGSNVDVEVRLTSREQSGLLVIKSTLGGVDVHVDGLDLGVAPAEAGLAPGPHRVEVDKDGFDRTTTQVVVQRGERKELFLDPLERPPITKRWWFWAGLGAVVVGATTTVVLLTTERPTGSGDFSPGRLTF